MQLRRLDPMANAGPYQRLVRNPVKSFSLSEVQYELVRERRPNLIVTEGEAAVIGLPLRDFLEVNYAYPDIEMFVDRFPSMLEKLASGSNKTEAPRGMAIAFRDRPNRMTADTVFWSLAMDQGDQWVEMNLVAVPETPSPSPEIGDGYEIVAAESSQDGELRRVEAEGTGLPELSPAGIETLRQNSRFLGLIRRKGAAEASGLVSLRTEPGGWGVIDLNLLSENASAARRPVVEWAVAWLRNNGGRRVRTRVEVDDSATLGALKDAGFTPGEAGLYLMRSVDKAEIDAKMDERKSHGTIIKFGDWR
jgi:hypothetical protein